MRHLLKTMMAAALLLASPAIAQPAYKPGVALGDTNPTPMKIMCWTGSAYAQCNPGTGGGGGGGGGDASANNQITQITQMNTLIAALGDVTTPVAGSTNYLLKNGIVVNTHAVTQSGTWTVALSGTLPAFATTPTFNLGTLNGAATAAAQATLLTEMQSVRDRIGSLTAPAAGSTNALLTLLNSYAADTTPVATVPKASATTARTSVTGAASSTLLLATNAARTGCSIVNDSGAILYIGLSTSVSATSYEYVIDAKTTVGGSFECPFGWTGPVYGIWASATGAARVGERSQ